MMRHKQITRAPDSDTTGTVSGAEAEQRDTDENKKISRTVVNLQHVTLNNMTIVTKGGLAQEGHNLMNF